MPAGQEEDAAQGERSIPGLKMLSLAHPWHRARDASTQAIVLTAAFALCAAVAARPLSATRPVGASPPRLIRSDRGSALLGRRRVKIPVHAVISVGIP